MKKLFLFIILLFPLMAIGQDCDCESNFEWVKKTFEENDAGFQYIIDKKGSQAYALHNQVFMEKAKSTDSGLACSTIMNEWLQFFRKEHLGIQYIGQAPNPSVENSDKGNEEEMEEEWESYSTDLNKFKKYLDKKQEHDLEGIWKMPSYTIAIKKESDQYIGFIVDSKYEDWKEGHIKLKLKTDGEKIKSEFYMRDRSVVASENVVLLNPNNLQIGDSYLSRTYPAIEDNSPYDLYIKSIKSYSPFLEDINNSTLYFRVPSFTGTPEKLAIDSVILANKNKILNTENLIIDIRNGTGGSDFTYEEIMKLLYTHPIRSAGIEYLSTPLNNQRMLDFSKNEGLAVDFNITFSEEQRKEFSQHYETLSKSLGKYVNLSPDDATIKKYDTIHTYPKNVVIIHNENNGSTDEQFLLEARQSKKVKLLGVPTRGALDISNLNRAISPSGDFALWYGLTKSLRVPNMVIDNIGIQPDYFMNAEIPEYKWLDYTVDLLSER